MNRMWKEPLLLMLLGLASIGVVLSLRQLLMRPSSESSNVQTQEDRAVLLRQVEESKDHIRRLERRLKETEVKLQDLEPPSSSGGAPLDTEARDPEHDRKLVPSMAQGPARYQEALARAWQYLQIGKFDPVVQKEILSDLEEAYSVTGLPPEANSNLVSTIERMNDLGVSAVISESQALPIKEASETLQTFLDTTPRLSARQKDKIKAALRKRSSK